MPSCKKIDATNFLIFLFISGSVVLDPGDNLMKVIKVIFVIPCFANILKSHKAYFDTYSKWMLCVTGFAGLSFFWAISISNAAYRYQTLVLNFICIYCLMVYITDSAVRINILLKTLLIAPIMLEMRVIVSFGLQAFVDTRSLDGLMSPNAIGMRAGIAVGLGAYFFSTEKNHRVLYLLSIVLNTTIVVLSASRKAVLFVMIPLTMYYIFSQRNSLKLLKNTVLAVVSISLVCYGIMNIPFAYNIIGYRIETMINGITGAGKTDGSTSLRLAMIRWGLEWFKSKPWIGYGINNYMNLLGTMKTSFGNIGAYAHNNYIELLVDLGLIGTAIYYFIYLKILVKIVKFRKRLSQLQLIMASIFTSIVINEFGMVTYIELYVQIILVLTWLLLFPLGEKLIVKENVRAME